MAETESAELTRGMWALDWNVTPLITPPCFRKVVLEE
jgi:hypothetical protein